MLSLHLRVYRCPHAWACTCHVTVTVFPRKQTGFRAAVPLSAEPESEARGCQAPLCVIWILMPRQPVCQSQLVRVHVHVSGPFVRLEEREDGGRLCLLPGANLRSPQTFLQPCPTIFVPFCIMRCTVSRNTGLRARREGVDGCTDCLASVELLIKLVWCRLEQQIVRLLIT